MTEFVVRWWNFAANLQVGIVLVVSMLAWFAYSEWRKDAEEKRLLSALGRVRPPEPDPPPAPPAPLGPGYPVGPLPHDVRRGMRL